MLQMLLILLDLLVLLRRMQKNMLMDLIPIWRDELVYWKGNMTLSKLLKKRSMHYLVYKITEENSITTTLLLFCKVNLQGVGLRR